MADKTISTSDTPVKYKDMGDGTFAQIMSASGAVAPANVFKNLSAVVITSETTIWTPASGKKFRLMGLVLAQGVLTGAITLKDNTAGSTILIIPPTTVGVSFQIILGNGILSATADFVLTATGSTGETLTGFVYGREE